MGPRASQRTVQSGGSGAHACWGNQACPIIQTGTACGAERMASTIGKYLVQIQLATRVAGIYAYRGQQDSEWPLHSAAARRLREEHGDDVLRDLEFPQMYAGYHRDALIEPARTRGFGSEAGRRLSDLEVLAKLQHFGAATGLLDFTWSALVALWFSCEDSSRDGKLFCININDATLVSRISTDEGGLSATAVFSGDAGSRQLSYWEPPLSGDASARILRQRSVFVIGRPLLPEDTDIVSEIIISGQDKESLRDELESLDVHEESLFLDVYGFAQASARRPVPSLTSGAYQRRGNRHLQKGEYAEAVAAYSRSLELGGTVGLMYLLRANAHSASGHHHEAVEDYDRAEERHDELPHYLQSILYFNRGNANSSIPNNEAALGDYSSAITLQPDLKSAYYNRGNIYMDLYRFEEAISDYERVNENPPQHANANKALALVASGRLPEARREYAEALEREIDRELNFQNLWTLDQILELVANVEYTVKAVPDDNTGAMCLRFEVPEAAEEARDNLARFVFRGRAGNTGNSGAPGLVGGEGSEGKPAVRVYVDVP